MSTIKKLGGRPNKLIVPGMNGQEIVKDYNEIHLHEGTEARVAKLEMFIAKRIGERLVAAYPNRQWGVQVDIHGRTIVIQCPSVSKTKGYFIHMKRRTLHDLQERAIQAAGEILERHGVSRGRVFNPDVLETLKFDSKDDAITPDSKPDPIQKRVV